MARPSSSTAAAAAADTCCKAPVLIDEGSLVRRCQSCGAQWTRAVKEGDYTAWQRVTTAADTKIA